ncbi:relaxase/mobilization nuclease domain-containing protein [Lachnospiraceae bacterium OttesenSCG-928-D06]|nr:relaxase/mobilization nuclease domain-containing protein [Lachnospiraceae bacterium OttesenSCG-928-D06]
MAITKIHPITATVDKAIAYICDPKKTDDKMLISSHACAPETAAIDFKYTLDHCREHGVNKAYHLIQAFAPDEVSFDEAHQIGEELASKVLEGKYSYVLTTHIDKGHVHNHIIFCAANNLNYDKYNDCTKSYYRIRTISDELCKEHNLSTISHGDRRSKKYNEWQADKDNLSWKSMIRRDINQSIKAARDYSEFIAFMTAKGYELKEGKYIAFRPSGKERFVRGSKKSLGANFTLERIHMRLEYKYKLTTSSLNNRQDLVRLLSTDSKPDFINNPAFQKWAIKENLKIAAKTYRLMNEKNLYNLDKLKHAIAIAQSKYNFLNEHIKSLEKRLSQISEVTKFLEQYLDNEPYHNKYNCSKDKDRYFRKYETRIILFEGAKKYLMQMNITPSHSNLTNLKSQQQNISDRIKTDCLNLSINEKELTDFTLIQTNIEKYLYQNQDSNISKNTLVPSDR